MSEERLTPGRCREIEAVLREITSALGLNLRPAADLAVMIRELSWMGTFPDSDYQPDAAFLADHERAIAAFLLVDQAHRIAQAWIWGRAIPGAAEGAHVIRQRLDRNRCQEGPAHDFLFELDIAARLARRGAAVCFEEPDLVLNNEGADPVGLACKRPHSIAGVANALRRASKQIRRSGIPGAIVLGLEALFHRSGDPARPVVIYRGLNRKDVMAEAARQVAVIEASVKGPLRRACSSEGVAGVLLCGVMTAWVDEPSAHIFQWVWRPVARPDSAQPIEALGRLLFNNDPLGRGPTTSL